MSSSYSANQFESAFRSQRLQNWCETKQFKQRPTAQEGHTTFIADNRGHLLPGLMKNGSAWPDFKGTWDLPARVPAQHINPTGRSEVGISRLRTWGFDPGHTRTLGTHPGSRHSDRQQDAGKQSNDSTQKDRAASSPAVEARPASQDRLVSSGGQIAVSPGSDRAAGRCATSQRASSRAHSDKGGAGSDGPQKVVPTGLPCTSEQSQRDAEKDK
ncbi:protein Flattop isoform X2 [Notolabrus celidotus]|uniref:protein Flattop isoform X2 n=1 Tax=Notolabrus celidotus TaxID=1203425 RepID=UPI00148F8FCF|nr:protein Flattop isoform X2 [Notolabrus celidotus]